RADDATVGCDLLEMAVHRLPSERSADVHGDMAVRLLLRFHRPESGKATIPADLALCIEHDDVAVGVARRVGEQWNDERVRLRRGAGPDEPQRSNCAW